MSAPTTIDRLADEAWPDVKEYIDGASFALTEDEAIRHAADSVVSGVTTELFSLVVADNALAFLDYEGEADDPFNALRGAIVQAVEAALYERYEAATEEEDDDE